MKAIKSIFLGMVLVNVFTLIIMAGLTFSFWENYFLHYSSWDSGVRALYFVFNVAFIFICLPLPKSDK